MNKPIPNSESITQTFANWKRKGLSTRACYLLAKAGISEIELAAYTDITALLTIRNCGLQTAQELWNFIENPMQGIREVKFEDLIPK